MNKSMEIKKAIICKKVQAYNIDTRFNAVYVPKAGDVAIFKVLEIGKHQAIQSESGKNAYIFPGDYIMGAFGNRYATNQFEGYVPKQVEERYQILGQGGCVGVLASTHAKLQLIGATQLMLVGYVTNKHGKIINTEYLHTQPVQFDMNMHRSYKTILSVGSSMDSGKTTSAAYLARGLKRAGKRVGFIKLTGTVFSKDKRFVKDCGAEKALDFSDLGFPSTYMYGLEDLLKIYATLLQQLTAINPDYIIIEIADGLLQRETSLLLHDFGFMSTVDHILLSCADSLGVLSGLDFLSKINFRPFGISGSINASPLLVEETKRATKIPVLDLDDLSNAQILNAIENKVYQIKSA